MVSLRTALKESVDSLRQGHQVDSACLLLVSRPPLEMTPPNRAPTSDPVAPPVRKPETDIDPSDSFSDTGSVRYSRHDDAPPHLLPESPREETVRSDLSPSDVDSITSPGPDVDPSGDVLSMEDYGRLVRKLHVTFGVTDPS